MVIVSRGYYVDAPGYLQRCLRHVQLKPLHMQKPPHRRVSKPSPTPLRSEQSLETAFRAAIRQETAGPVTSLAATLERLAKRLVGKPRQARPAPTTSNLELLLAATPVRALVEAAAPAAAPEPAVRACAVIGCKRPHRSQGYCAAHYQKRRLMVATGRLHAAWVENAAPHSIPDVILPRGRKPRSEVSSPPVEVQAPLPAPRVWVRKKGQGVLPLGTESDSAAAASSAGPGGPNGASTGDTRPVQGSEQELAVAAAQRWVSDFLAAKRGA